MKRAHSITALCLSVISLTYQSNMLCMQENTLTVDLFENFEQGTYLALLPADVRSLLIKALSYEPFNLLPFRVTDCLKEIHSVTSAAFNRAGDKIVITFLDKTANIYNSDGTVLVRLIGHDCVPNSALFNQSGTTIVTASYENDNTARLWNIDGKLVAILNHESVVNSARFNVADDKIVTASLDKTAKVWTKDGSLIATLEGHNGNVNSAVFNEQGDKVLTASSDWTAKIWSCYGNLLKTLEGHARAVSMALFNRAGDKIVTASDDKTAKVWVSDGTLLSILQHAGVVYQARFNNAGDKIVTACEDYTARTWTCDGVLLVILNHNDCVFSAMWSPLDNKIFTSVGQGTLSIWTPSGVLLHMHHHRGNRVIVSAAFNALGDKIISTYADGTLRAAEQINVHLSLPEMIALHNICSACHCRIYQEAEDMCYEKSLDFKSTLSILLRKSFEKKP